MARKTAILIPLIAAAAVIGIAGIAFAPPEVKEKNIDFPKGTVSIDNSVITVEIAESAAERQRWMTFREDTLPLNSALLLKYEKPDLYPIWMANVNYNLDLIWLDESGNVMYLIKDAPPCGNIFETVECTYKNTKPALYVIAATSGFIDEYGIDLDSKMTAISI